MWVTSAYFTCVMEDFSVKNLRKQIAVCFKVYGAYAWLLNCYVLDFFTANHWNKLSHSWKTSLADLNSVQIADLLNYDKQTGDQILPLSLLTLKQVLVSHSLPRRKINVGIEDPYFTKDEKLLKLFWKNVKAKKRHEISVMSKICCQSAEETNCFYIVDIGSGLGHLSRILNYGYGFQVCAIEAQEILSNQAEKLDCEFEKTLKQKCKGYSNYHKTVHLNQRIEPELTVNEFLMLTKRAFNIKDNDFKFGIVGLHPCGDLGATLLKIFNECSQAQYINIVGCCYMKLTSQPEFAQGFPLSKFCQTNQHVLSYHSREVACHAIENYIEKLLKGECWRLKVHTYRAALEKLITTQHPHYHHCALSSVKYTQDLTFENYCKRAIKKLKISFSEEDLKSEEMDELLKQWKKVVVFYSLRLLFAPFIETIIHLDRVLYLKESGNDVNIMPVFDASISPRNQVVTAKKKITYDNKSFCDVTL